MNEIDLKQIEERDKRILKEENQRLIEESVNYKISKRTVAIQKSYQFQTYKVESEVVFEGNASEEEIDMLTRKEIAHVRKEVIAMIRTDFPNYMVYQVKPKKPGNLDQELANNEKLAQNDMADRG